MAIPPDLLPPALCYIVPLAEKHGANARVVRFDRSRGQHVTHAQTLTPGEITALAGLYEEIRAKDHCVAINQWCEAERKRESFHKEAVWSVNGLLMLFDQLAKLRIEPFKDAAIGCRELTAAVPLDWSTLPPELRYLAKPAEFYGQFQFESRIRDFLLDEMTAAHRAELLELRPRYFQDYEAIDR